MHEISDSPERDELSTPRPSTSLADLDQTAEELHAQALRLDEATRMANRLTWFLVTVAGLLLLRFVVPYFAEHIQYAITRGRERAKLEIAEQGLQQVPLDQLSKAYQLVSKRVGPSVVHIRVASLVDTAPSDELDSLFGYPRRESEGQGSGVIVDPAGYIVTNNHVVRGATEIHVSLSDGRTVDGTVEGVDALTDIAVVKIDAGNLSAAECGDSDDLEVGAMVWAVGSPFGLERSITFGILSAKDRASMAGTAWQDFLQTDAAVNPGNSGGPLVDARGRIIGINTAIVGESYQGISFAIPSRIAQRVYEKLRVSGDVERGWLGVQLGDVTEEAAREFGWPVKHGAYIHAVVNDRRKSSPAHRAGIKPGDIVITWNGKAIRDSAALSRLVARAEIGSDAEVVVVRDGQEMTVTVNVAARPVQLQ